MAARLLNQQASLLEYLTSGIAIFDKHSAALLDRPPFGIHRGLLHLEARYSFEKRMAKIRWVLPRTLDLLGGDRAPIILDFVEACPPVSLGRLENARQFHEFLLARWRDEARDPPHLPDVASFEIAYAALRGGEIGEADSDQNDSVAPRGAIRRSRRLVLLRCSYDIRPILEASMGEAAAIPCDTRLALAIQAGAVDPVVLALSREFFDLLEMLDEFHDPAIFWDTPSADELIANLAASGLLEVHQ